MDGFWEARYERALIDHCQNANTQVVLCKNITQFQRRSKTSACKIT